MLCSYRLLATHARKKNFMRTVAKQHWHDGITLEIKKYLKLIRVKTGILDKSSAIISTVHVIEYPEFQK